MILEVKSCMLRSVGGQVETNIHEYHNDVCIKHTIQIHDIVYRAHNIVSISWLHAPLAPVAENIQPRNLWSSHRNRHVICQLIECCKACTELLFSQQHATLKGMRLCRMAVCASCQSILIGTLPGTVGALMALLASYRAL